MRHSILVIDDDAAVQRILVQHLASSETKVYTASDGATGLAVAQQSNPDLILLDVDMPGMNGHEVCRRLKFDPNTQGIPVAFLTSAASVSERIAGLDHGAVDFIAKPFDPFEVAARTRAAFRTQATIEKIKSGSMPDELTGLGSRRAFEEHLQAELARAHRSAESLACVLCEIDGINELIETHGGPTCDSLLCDLADILKSGFRTEDRIFRYSQKSIAIIAPNVNAHDATALGERMQWAVQSSPLLRNRAKAEITISVGLAISRLSFGRSVVDEAAEALAQAKEAGGNKAVTAGDVIELQLAV